MANVLNLTSKILEEAKAKKCEILANADAEKNRIIEKKVNDAKEEEVEILERAKREAETRKERIISNTVLKVRNQKLEAKGEIISKVFNNAVEELSKLSGSEFKNFVKSTIENIEIIGDENIILNDAGAKIITSDFVNEINESLKNKGKVGNLKLKGETCNFNGGFILEKNGIEINLTFEALVESLKDELEFEVANVLFN